MNEKLNNFLWTFIKVMEFIIKAILYPISIMFVIVLFQNQFDVYWSLIELSMILYEMGYLIVFGIDYIIITISAIFYNYIICFHSGHLLFSMIVLLAVYIFVIILIPAKHKEIIKEVSLYFTSILFILSLILWLFYNNEEGHFGFVVDIPWLASWNIYYSIGLDGISIFFIVLTTFLIPICIMTSWESIQSKVKLFTLMLLLTEFCLINVFCVLDLLFFYIFFESILIPMYIIVGIYGSRQRKIHAAYQFFFYTLLGSIIMLIGILVIYFHVGTTDIQVIIQTPIGSNKQIFLWMCFFSSFAVKIPMLPVHIWLPEAHVEAPTAGSVILAGVLLKLGTYGIIRFLIPMFPYAMTYFTPLVFTMCVVGVIYSSATTIRQIDLKKIIAYSSVAHMNFALLGLFTNNMYGIEGSLYLMLGHGVVSSGLFLCIGILYDRYHTRNILYYGGLVQMMPIFSIIFLIFILANIGFPGTVNFIGEFLILIGLWHVNTTVTFLSATGMVLGAVYSIWLFNRLMYGQMRFNSLQKFRDINRRELNLLSPLVFLTIYMGIYPTIFFGTMSTSISNYINYY